MEKEPNSDPSEPEEKPSKSRSGLASFWAELKRRKVMRVAITYIVVAWLVIQVAVNTFPSLLIPGWALSFVVMCVILGFPVALVLAWAFELTPEGIKTTKVARNESTGTEESAGDTRKHNWLAIGFAAALPTVIFGTLALFFYVRSGVGPQSTSEEKSIAVLPFDNRSNIEEDQFFTDGVHDDLLTHISQISDIDTKSRTSVMVYRDSPKQMRTIAEELGVATILEGGVQRAGNQIRINVQLIDARTDSHLWAQIFNREMNVDNLLEIQTEIAVTIAEKLKAVISPGEKKRIETKPTQSLEALEAYFKGRDIYYSMSRTRRSEAIELFNKAVEIDPEFTMAYVYLGLCHLSPPNPAENITWETSLAEAEKAAERALELDDSLAEVHVLWANLYSHSKFQSGSEENSELAKASFEMALEINPKNAEGLVRYAEFLSSGSDIRDSELIASTRRLFEKAVGLDPQNASLRLSFGQFLRYRGYFEEAKEQLETSIRINPNLAQSYYDLAHITLSCYGRFDEAISIFRKSLEVDPLRNLPHYMLSVCYEMLGDMQASYRWHKPLKVIGSRVLGPPVTLAFEYRVNGNKEKWLEQLRHNFQEATISIDRRHLLNMDLREGRAAEALERYQSNPRFAYLFEEKLPVFTRVQAQVAFEVAEILIQIRDKERAYQLLDQAWDLFQHYPREGWSWYGASGYGIRDAMIHALKGDKRQALDAIKVAVDGGFRDRWELESSVLDSIREEPEFQAAMEIVEADWARQLANVRRMEANGELARIPAETLKLMGEE